MLKDVFIVSAQRTPVTAFQGAFSNTPAPKLGTYAIQSALKAAQISAENVDECIMGQVLTAGCGQAPARQAALGAGLANHTPCLTINKVCGSGVKAVALAADSIQLGHSSVVVAGGQENMTQAPHLMTNVRAGYRMGHQSLIDSMINDGLWDPYNNFHMGSAAELCAKEYNFSREAQDEFAKESYTLAQEAQKAGHFKNEITPVELQVRKKSLLVEDDEEPGKAKFDKMPSLRPAFQADGTITAANASKINDGAAALVLANQKAVDEQSLKPMAKIIGYSTYAQEPKWFTTAPVGAMKAAFKKYDMTPEDIDLYEINEAFSVVTMAAIKEFGLPREKVNSHGGAIAIGHPIGASGARILTTLLHALKTQNKKYGMTSICIGGGEAMALIVEAL